MAIRDLHPESDGSMAPVDDWIEITPDDDNDLAFKPVAVSVGDTAGTVVCRGKSGNDVAFYFAAGEVKPIRPVRILSTGTDPGLTIIIHPS